ncbi:MAG: threonine--tRNA ligase [Bacilli bacterium]|jgi:threonyl-tRNA synthetase|nr:threonine--tRNA ligase [Bacilli bacterium]MCH4210237.1 threonine--tRNA ligase [Bacilli bacterium]MCH4228419.1 threonine--tRNA ligase [Bacilli bacterium]MCH4278029.1 threonine--tRNA ligase [Bacilli bacterium]MCI2055157.1 threonine--tRNA ligase [Bacilli bacterium]
MKIVYEGKEIEINPADTGFSLAKSLDAEQKSKDVAYVLNGKEYDMREPIKEDGSFSFIKEGSPEAFELLNHSTSHLMAQAIIHLYPNAKFGFGPSIEEGYYYDVDFGDQVITDADLVKIEAEMKKLSKENYPFVREEVSPEKAMEIFKANPYKEELIKEHQGELISIYKQGDFTDFCRGPHVPSTGYIKHFKLLSVAGAYWRGDSKNKQLTRIYGTSWWSEEDLQNHLAVLEKRKANDHRKLGKELGLFFISDYGPGFPFFLPNGMVLKNSLLDYWHQVHRAHDYLEIETPTMLSRELWETSGHWDHYKENMYTTKIDGKDFAIKPMNCPGAILVYKNDIHSYKEFPLRYAELGHVHRHEASGALNGLFRVRAFTQDDAHIMIRPDQIESEVKAIMALFDEVYNVFGLSYHIVLSTRPEKDYIGTEEYWKRSEAALAQACKDSGHEYTINPGDGAFYGPKLDFKLKDSMGRTWQCGTIQLDVNLPHRFGCYYIDENGEKKEPYMLHRVVFGSVERFIGIITENYGGAFPTWLSPVQCNVLPVNSEVQGEYAKKVQDELKKNGVRCELDASNEKLGYRLRNSQIRKIPFTLVVGDKEMENSSVTYRVFGSEKQTSVSLEEFVKIIRKSIDDKACY